MHCRSHKALCYLIMGTCLIVCLRCCARNNACFGVNLPSISAAGVILVQSKMLVTHAYIDPLCSRYLYLAASDYRMHLGNILQLYIYSACYITETILGLSVKYCWNNWLTTQQPSLVGHWQVPPYPYHPHVDAVATNPFYWRRYFIFFFPFHI